MDNWYKDIKLAGTTGFKRSGKDTTGDHMQDEHGYISLSLAGNLKKACGAVFTFSDAQLYGDQKEVIDPRWKHTPREILQKVGTELFRERLAELCDHIDNDIWIKSLEIKMMDMYRQDPVNNNKFIITDVRFDNEAEFIKRLGGVMIRVNRFDYTDEEVSKMHKSERSIPLMDVDYDIDNRGTLDDLYRKVDEIIENDERL